MATRTRLIVIAFALLGLSGVAGAAQEAVKDAAKETRKATAKGAEKTAEKTTEGAKKAGSGLKNAVTGGK